MTNIQERLHGIFTSALHHWYALLIGFVIIGFAGHYGQLFGADFDEAFNLQIPKQFALGMGYSTFDGELFDPQITTGFPVLLPIAFMFKVFGVGLLKARVVMVGYLAFFLILSYILIYRWYGKLAASIGLIYPVLIDRFPSTALTVLGELPGAVFLLASILFLDLRLFFLAGLALSLSIQTKLIYVFGLAAAGVFFLVELIQHRHDRVVVKKTLSQIAVFVIGFLLPFLAWEIYRIIALGPQGYQANIDKIIWLFNYQNTTGITVTRATISERLSTISAIFMQEPLVGGVLAALAILNPIVQIYICREKNSRVAAAQLCMPVFCTLYFFWWLFMKNDGWLRHIYPALLVLALLSSVLIAQWVQAAIRLIREQGSERTTQNMFYGFGILFILLSFGILISNTSANQIIADIQFSNFKTQNEFASVVREMDSKGNLFVYFNWFQSPEVSFMSGVKFYDMSNPDHVNIVQAARKRGVKAYCLVTPPEQRLTPELVQERIDKKICGEPFIQNNGYEMREYIQ